MSAKEKQKEQHPHEEVHQEDDTLEHSQLVEVLLQLLLLVVRRDRGSVTHIPDRSKRRAILARRRAREMRRIKTVVSAPECSKSVQCRWSKTRAILKDVSRLTGTVGQSGTIVLRAPGRNKSHRSEWTDWCILQSAAGFI